MSTSKTIISGVSWTVIQNVVSILYGLVSVPFLINYFGKEEYGLIGLALSVNVYIQLLDMGMTNSNVRFFTEYIEKHDKLKLQGLFSMTNLLYIVIGIINTVILLVVSFSVDKLFNVSTEQAITLRNLLLILALNATFSWLSTCFDQILRAKDLIDWIKKRSTILKLLQFIILAVVIFFNLSIEVYFLGYVFIATFILPLTIIKTRKLFPSLILDFSFDKAILISILPYVISIFSFSIFQFLASSFRPLFLGNISGPGSVADFNILNTIVSVITIFSNTFTQVLLPIVTRMSVSNNQTGIYKIIEQGSKYVNMLLTCIIFTIIISSKEVLEFYVGKGFISINQWLVLWLLMLLLGHRNVMTSLVFTQLKLRSVAMMGCVAMFAALICYRLLIPSLGVGGVVVGYLVHELIHTFFYYCYYFPQKMGYNSIQLFLRSILPTWISAGLIGAIVLLGSKFLFLPPIAMLAVKSLSFGVVFILSCWFILFSNKDRCFVVKGVKSIIYRK